MRADNTVERFDSHIEFPYLELSDLERTSPFSRQLLERALRGAALEDFPGVVADPNDGKSPTRFFLLKGHVSEFFHKVGQFLSHQNTAQNQPMFSDDSERDLALVKTEAKKYSLEDLSAKQLNEFCSSLKVSKQTSLPGIKYLRIRRNKHSITFEFRAKGQPCNIHFKSLPAAEVGSIIDDKFVQSLKSKLEIYEHLLKDGYYISREDLVIPSQVHIDTLEDLVSYAKHHFNEDSHKKFMRLSGKFIVSKAHRNKRVNSINRAFITQLITKANNTDIKPSDPGEFAKLLRALWNAAHQAADDNRHIRFDGIRDVVDKKLIPNGRSLSRKDVNHAVVGAVVNECVSSGKFQLATCLLIQTFVGVRSTVARELKWRDFDLNFSLVKLYAYRDKAGYDREYPVPAVISTLLRALHQKACEETRTKDIGNEYVFQSPRKPSSPISQLSNPLSKVKKALLRRENTSFDIPDIKDFTQHRIRTFAYDYFYELEVPDDIIKFLIGQTPFTSAHYTTQKSVRKKRKKVTETMLKAVPQLKDAITELTRRALS